MSVGSLSLKVLGGLMIVAASFGGTTALLNWLSSDREQAALGKPLVITGSAAASTPVLQDATKFQFDGKGFVTIEGTADLQCATNKCGVSLVADFTSSNAGSGEILVGQSYAGEHGWHLLWIPGQLILQPDGGGNQIASSFSPTIGQQYKIEITNASNGVSMLVNDKEVALNKNTPFTNIARNITVGGRAGAAMNGFVGNIHDLKITHSQ